MDKSNILNLSAAVGPLLYSFQELFGDSLKRFCEAIIYIVTCHPYDVGDRVSIDGVDFFVHKIGLVSTTFKRFDGFMVWFPNYSLSKKALCNIRRTGMQGQRLEIHVDASVPIEKLQKLSATIREFIKNDTKTLKPWQHPSSTSSWTRITRPLFSFWSIASISRTVCRGPSVKTAFAFLKGKWLKWESITSLQFWRPCWPLTIRYKITWSIYRSPWRLQGG